ncbi:MAG: RidA family protein [Hoeflea sp.]|uniref:RidA family protein n=1 Tax=Hoeflea sp. TaxID=1940281 RepID=UPI002731F250|nr:RidA family protein [Hoeflea sp.]MDP2118987.1 RidA family protein [Hoeflea sp.]
MTQMITRLNPPSLPDAGALGYSQISIVEPGRMAFISGQVAARLGGEPVPADLVEQAGIVMANAKAALDALGATPRDIAILRIYVVDLTPERLHLVMPPLLAMLDGAQPSITGLGVAALAGPDLQVEMELTVRLPD